MNAAILIAVGALFLGGKWERPAFLQKKPPIAQLTAAQIELAAAKAAQAQAETALAAARAEQKAKTDAQLDYAQQMSVGASAALARVPAEHTTPEVKLAAELSARANEGLEAARGKLSPAAQAEITLLINQALSAKTAEVEAYKIALAAKDADLQLTIREKAEVAAKIPALESAVKVKDAEVLAKDATAATLQAKVVAYAQQTSEERARAGSLDAYAGNLMRALIGIGVLYLFIHFALPSLAQEFPGSRVLSGLNKTVKSISSAHL